MEVPHGIIPAMVTPLTADDHIDESALRILTDHLIAGGVHGLFATGSQGEFWALSADEKVQLWQIVVEQTDGRVPVYAGTAGTTTRETIALSRAAEDAGVDAVSILTPFFISPTQNELGDHYRAIADATGLPILLYGNPGRTGVKITPGLLAELAGIENIVGIKDSSGDLQLTLEYIQVAPPGFSVLMGRDTLILAGLLYGAKGAIAATGNVAPALVVSIYERFVTGDLDGARKAQAALTPLRLAFSWGTFPVVVKEAMDLIGIPAGPARAPVGAMPSELRERLKSVLRDLGLI